MTGSLAYSATGVSTDAITYPLEDDHSIDKLQDIEEAITYANEALEVAARLEQSHLELDGTDSLTTKLLNVAVENYIERFNIPMAALEDNAGPAAGEPPEASRLKKVVLYLYAVVERIFRAIFDFFSNEKSVARKLIPLTTQYIGQADSLPADLADRLSISNRSLINALQIDGLAPKNAPELFNKLAKAFEEQHAFSPVAEIIRLVGAAKDKNAERIKVEAANLRNKLEAGLKATMAEVNPQTLTVFNESKSDTATYYASEPSFGQNYILGIVAKQVGDNDTFRFYSGVRQDKQVPVRLNSFPVLTPTEIRDICRTALRVSENIVRFSRDEDLLQKALRQAAFLTTKEADKETVTALRNIVAVGQNSYITYLRFTAHTAKLLMRWCAASIKSYHNAEKSHG